jgi:hypothetical protein
MMKSALLVLLSALSTSAFAPTLLSVSHMSI